MPAPQGAPAWASELALAYESGAHGLFILYGNVHDRMAVGDRLVNLAGYLGDTLLSSFRILLAYDLGNGLVIERGGELVGAWGRGSQPRPASRSRPPVASRYLRTSEPARSGRDPAELRGAAARVDQSRRRTQRLEHGSPPAAARWASEAPSRAALTST